MTERLWQVIGRGVCLLPLAAAVSNQATLTYAWYSPSAHHIPSVLAALAMLILMHPAARPGRAWVAVALWGWLYWFFLPFH